MASRLDLHHELKRILGLNNVYFQPPESIKMSYPAIRYSMSDIDVKKANNTAYLFTNCYEIIVISTLPNMEVVNELLKLPMCSFDRSYNVDNLYHYVLKLYY